MQIEVNEIEPCKLSVHYTADAEEILNKRGDIINAFKKAPVPGFRQGKASVDAIRMHYRTQIEDSLKRALTEDAYHNTLFEKKLKPHGPPRFNSVLLADGKFVCEFEMLTKPDFELAEFANMEIPKPHEPENIAELTEKMLQELRVRFGEASPYTESDFVENGDNVILDYEGSLDGEKIDNLTSTGEMLTVGASPLRQFDDNLLGMTLGEVREFDILVPENGLPSLAGKNVHVKATLVMGSKTTPCPLDDTLAHKMNKKDFTELREFVTGTAMAAVKNKFKNAINEAVANRLVTNNVVNVPNWMSLSEAQYLAHQSKLDWATLDNLDKERYLEMAEKNVKLSLILDKIRDENPEAQLTDQEVFEVFKAHLAKTQAPQSIDDVIQQMNKTGYLQILFSRIRDEHTMDFITKTVRVIE
jgi:trigger factor